MRLLVSLVMIVKNEAKSIRKVLEAALPHVDRWTIIDTGSADGTQAIIREAVGDKPGTLYEESFQGYATSRNHALALDAQGFDDGTLTIHPHLAAVFQLMLSGDEILRGGGKMREHLEAHRDTDVDCHFVKLVVDEGFNTTRSFFPRITRAGSAWQYKSDLDPTDLENLDPSIRALLPRQLHEFPTHPDPEAKRATAIGVTIEHNVTDVEGRLNNIWEVHIPILEAKIAEEPENEYALICLAQSYESLLGGPGFDEGERITYAAKVMSLYLRRLRVKTGNPVERNYCKMHYLAAARVAGVYDDVEVYNRAAALVQEDPARPELALMLARAALKVTRVVSHRDIYKLFARAAQVAADADSIDNSSPIQMGCGAEANYYAAVVARQLAAKYPDEEFEGEKWEARVRQHISDGLMAGGTWALFKSLNEPAKPKTETSPTEPPEPTAA